MANKRAIAGIARTVFVSGLVGLAAACNSPSGPSSEESVIYATAQEGAVLVAIDPGTGAASVVGSLDVSGAFAMASRAEGVFFTVTDSGFSPNPDARLATVDVRRGARPCSASRTS